MGAGPNQGGLSRKWVMQACEDSLRRLGTDFIDIYYLHKEDHATPLAETVRAIGDLVRQGKIRHFGVSNYRSWRLAEICRLCDDLGIDRPIVSQPYYNAMNRMPEVEHLPACGFYGLGVASYSPLARGVLTAKYEPGAAPPEGTRAGRGDKRIMQSEWREESLVIAQDDQAARRRARHDADPVRGALGAEQQAGDGGDRRAAHAGAMAGLSRGARRRLHRRGRGIWSIPWFRPAILRRRATAIRPILSRAGSAVPAPVEAGEARRRQGICLARCGRLTEGRFARGRRLAIDSRRRGSDGSRGRNGRPHQGREPAWSRGRRRAAVSAARASAPCSAISAPASSSAPMASACSAIPKPCCMSPNSAW